MLKPAILVKLREGDSRHGRSDFGRSRFVNGLFMACEQALYQRARSLLLESTTLVRM